MVAFNSSCDCCFFGCCSCFVKQKRQKNQKRFFYLVNGGHCHTINPSVSENCFSFSGFFVSDFGGEGREIFLLLEKGSVYHKGFLKALEQSVYEAAEECGLKAITLTTINENNEDTELTENLELHQLYLPEETE